MPLALKKRLPEYEFYSEFNNTTRSFKTLLCFSLNRENKTLWDLWGYTYNDPCQSHAESIVLKEIERFFKENHLDTVQKYKLTLYMSFSPCYKCCESLANFLKSEERIDLHARASKLYFSQNSSNQKGLQQLKHLGVSLKVMDKEDFQDCFYLFVNELKQFEEWPDLEKMSVDYSAALEAILNQCETNTDSGNVSADIAALESSPLHTDPTGHFDHAEDNLAPDNNNRDRPSKSETPHKHSIKDGWVGSSKGVKRKLSFED
ncbi:DNA dC-_dU-editing enzyme APOBEC-3-like [Huso huso]|uniref:DNA dC->dU-editing enzyme APOBEC-3-like n=1 Tax=Huso huso TaxID=61971 RepID=A0ABR0ZLN8_HUSHU